MLYHGEKADLPPKDLGRAIPTSSPGSRPVALGQDSGSISNPGTQLEPCSMIVTEASCMPRDRVGAIHVYISSHRSAICRLDHRPRRDPMIWLQFCWTVALAAVSSTWGSNRSCVLPYPWQLCSHLWTSSSHVIHLRPH